MASATLLAACGSKSTSSKDEINWYTPTEILTLDVSKNTDHYSALAIGNSESNLLRVDKNGKLQPDLAEKVDVSADGLTYTATLRDDLKYSDGTKLTAEDFVYTWQRMVDPATASEYAYLASDSHLVNAADIIAGKKSVEELGVNGTSGSFKLVKNDNYWDAKHVKTKTINIQTVKKPDTAVQMYKQGQLDFASISSTSAIFNSNKKNKDVVTVPEATTSYMTYNETGKVKGLDNLKIRQALNLATDRKGIVEAAVDTGSVPATSLVPTGLEKLPDGTDLSKYVAPGYSYNKEEAAKLFKEGLAEAGLSDLKLTITADSDSPVSKAAVDYIKETWEKALPGLTVEEKFVTFKQRLEDTKNQNFDVALVLWGGDYPEGSTFYGLFTSNSAYNYGKANSSTYDAAYEKALSTDALDPTAAANDYKTAEKALYDEAMYNPIYFRFTKGLQNPSIKGLVRNSTGLDVDFTYAYKDK